MNIWQNIKDFIYSLVSPLMAKIFTALGLSFLSYSGLSALASNVDSFLYRFTDLSTMPLGAALYQLLLIGGFGVGLKYIATALIVRFALDHLGLVTTTALVFARNHT